MQSGRPLKILIVPPAKRRKLWLEAKYRDPESCLSSNEPFDYVLAGDHVPEKDERKRKIRPPQAAESRDRLQKSMETILSSPPPESVASSPLWKTINDAKRNAPLTDDGTRFVPMPLEHQAALEVSLVINLYDNGFSFDEQDVSYQYSRANASVADTVNLGILPGQLDQILQRADRFMKEGHQAQRNDKPEKPEEHVKHEDKDAKEEKPDSDGQIKEEKADSSRPNATPSGGTVTNVPTPITFYEGGIVIEVRDYREGRSTVSSSSSSPKPTTFKMYLKPDMHSLLYHLDSLHLTPKARLQIEQNLLTHIHPTVCLDPNFDVHAISTAMYYNINKFNIPTKTKSSRRKHRIVTTRQSVSPLAVSAAPSAVFSSAPDEPSADGSRSKLPLLSFLRQVHHSSFAQETLQQQQMRPASSSEKAASSASRQSVADPRPKIAMEPQPPIVGKHYFSHFVPAPTPPQQPHAQQAPPQQQRPQFTTEFITLEIKSSGGPPSELYHATVRPSLTAKPLQVTLGGPSMAQQFFHQFRKLENAATPDQIKYLQTLQQQQQQRAQQQQQQGQPPQGATNPATPSQSQQQQHQHHQQQQGQSSSTAQTPSLPSGAPSRGNIPNTPVAATLKREGDSAATLQSKAPVSLPLANSAAQQPAPPRPAAAPAAQLPPGPAVKVMQQPKYPVNAPKVPQGPQIAALQSKPALVPQPNIPGAPKQPNLPIATNNAPLNPALFKTMGPGASKPVPTLPVPAIPNQVPGAPSSVPTSTSSGTSVAPQTPPSASRPNTRQSSAKKK